ncbi:MAG TPA: family 20 glycosylhydrolase [Bacilli bacterium]|nr:family 20 glycosylhydrolase [Bacilli bacterium]
MARIYPVVKQMQRRDGAFHKPVKDLKDLFFFFDYPFDGPVDTVEKPYGAMAKKRDLADVVFQKGESLSLEGYEITVSPALIIIRSPSLAGVFYATLTLQQMVNQGPNLPCVVINDAPDLKIRGLMIDISRNKVPTLATLKNIIVMMSQLKMNHLELYVEGFSFGYPSFTKYLEADGFISVEEYQELETYANAHFIDLVPNQNGFGHMAKWLATEEFKDLAEQPEGIFLWGRHRPPSTLNPLDPQSLELIKTLYRDMLSIARSKYFNMNFDEPFELGKGRSKTACEEKGLGNVYIDFVLKAYAEIKKYQKTPLIWGDVLIHHPELLHRLPSDMLFIDWGYDGNYPFSAHLQKLHDLGIKFLAAPGTSSWCSFLGRKDDWLENITNACLQVKTLNGEGIILTDWGDFGHLQFLPISYAPLVLAGLMSWRVQEGTQFLLRDYLNQYVFLDQANIMADTIIDLGLYYHYLNEYRSNGTTTFHNFMWATVAVKEKNPIEYFLERSKTTILSSSKHALLEQFLALQTKALTQTKMVDGQLIVSELKQSIQLVLLIQYLNQSFNEELSIKERLSFVQKILDAETAFLAQQEELWLARNKAGGLKDSLEYLHKFFLFSQQTKKHLQRGGAYGA